ncbi:MAG: hypothetical protein NZ530_00880 [Thermodesulfobacteriaceae bacterium]|nr:hypothetical protein [Thermodesulfobacteriaceae bacterium]
MFTETVLLYPQTFLFPLKLKKIFTYFSQVLLLKLPISDKRINFWKENHLFSKIKYLEVNKITKEEEEILRKEIKLVQEWGLNFRTPETLKYLMQFRKVTEDPLEEYLSIIKKNKESDRALEKLNQIKYALILLSLAEELDFSLYEVETSLEQVEKKLSEFFEEKVIGEDLTFERLISVKNFSEEEISSETLSNLELRILSWKILIPHLNWMDFPFLKALLITEEDLIENWKETYDLKEETPVHPSIILYRFTSSLNDFLNLSKDIFSFPEDETIIFFVK